MRRLLPVTDASPILSAPAAPGSAPDADDRTAALHALADAYAYPADTRPGRPWLRANMVSSADGAARYDGRSEGLSSPGDKQIFGVLRALADVVLVGAETVRTEGYRPAKARSVFAERRAAAGQAPAPAIAIVSSRLDLDLTAPLFTEPLVPTVVLTVADAPADRLAEAERVADVVRLGEGRVDLAAAVRWLDAERGWCRQLTEGGPRLLGQLAALDLVDELDLALSPLMCAGEAPRITNGPSADVRMRLELLLEEDGFLFARYLRPRGADAAGADPAGTDPVGTDAADGD